MQLEKYTIGIGDRFGCQGASLLRAVMQANNEGVEIIPVWNKSSREHIIAGTLPASVRKEADNAVRKLGWDKSYYVDADHITYSTVEDFIDHCDFFTLDISEHIGKKADQTDIDACMKKYSKYVNTEINLPGLNTTLKISPLSLSKAVEKFYVSLKEASKIYNVILSAKGAKGFVSELSVDETTIPQTPEELFFILAMLSDENIQIQTIAPKFIGGFFKGIDYVGDTDIFSKQFEMTAALLKYSIKEFDLPANLKLSVHTGSDKYSIYQKIKLVIDKYNMGIHLKTAGTTWLEELTGLAAGHPNGLNLAKEIYIKALEKYKFIYKPYKSVVSIDKSKLPSVSQVKEWSAEEYISAVNHDISSKLYNIHFRQFMHLSYGVAAEMGKRFYDTLAENQELIGTRVTNNLNRHLRALFY